MPVTKTWAGGTFNLPLNREPKGSWGTEVSNFLISLANNALALTGGTQTLSAELNFGATYGLVSAYVKSASANIASSGMLRLAKGDSVAWRNNANGADLALGVNASDRLAFGGVAIPTISSTDALTAKTIVVSSNTITTASSGNLVSTELNAALSELQTHIDTKATSTTVTAHTGASSGVHGVTGSVVGTTDAQTLTNKTISGANNTLTVRLASDVSGTLPIGSGGTGQTAKTAAYTALTPVTTKGDIVGSDGTNGVRVPVGSDGTVLSADSTQTAGLKWVSPLTNPMSAAGDIIVGGSAGAATRLAGQTTSTKKFLTQTGTGAASATPGWNTIVAGDLPTTISAATTFSGGVVLGGGGTQTNLNWYEEGTWTPSVNSTATTGTVTYSVQSGYFTRIGRVVYYTFDVVLASYNGAGSGNLLVSGLPYTSHNDANMAQAGTIVAAGLTTTASYTQLTGLMTNNATTLRIIQQILGGATPGNTTTNNVLYAGMNSSATIAGSGFYII